MDAGVGKHVDRNGKINLRMPDRNLFKELLILVGVSFSVALCINYVSPKGIPLFGTRDPATGIVSADTRGDQDSLFNNIDRIETAKQIFDQGNAVFVDARSEESFNQGHIAGAVSLPLGRFQEKIQMFHERYGSSTPVVTYCSGRSCQDSHQLARLLAMNGYLDIRVFIDGYPAWKEKGYPSE